MNKIIKKILTVFLVGATLGTVYIISELISMLIKVFPFMVWPVYILIGLFIIILIIKE